MGFPWRKVISIGTGIAGVFVPGLASGIEIVEASLPKLKGADKRQAAKDIAKVIVTRMEGAAGKDLVDDARVEAATDEFVDAYVAVENAKAALERAKDELIQAIESAKALKSNDAQDDGA